MERANIHLIEVNSDVVGIQPRRDSCNELGSGFLRESGDKETLRLNPFLRNQIIDSFNERKSLARSRTRNNEQGSFCRMNSFLLLRVGS